jgi:5-methylcytosine-specific restriction endonuclease McrA
MAEDIWTKKCSRCGVEKSVWLEFNRKGSGFRAECKECQSADKKRYTEENYEEIRFKDSLYRERNKKKINERIRNWRHDNPEQYRAIHARWKTLNRESVNAATHRRRAMLRGCEDHWTGAEWEALKAACHHTCLCCGRQEPEVKLTVDHVIPVSKGGDNTITNVQPLCKSCNSAKHTADHDYRE